MRMVPAVILSMLAVAPALAARPAKAASSPRPTPPQAECTDDNPARGETRFAGQITGGPTGSLIEVTSGSETLLVIYNNSVPVCQGGRPAAVNALGLHENVVVYGPTKKKGKSLQMTASRILVAGESRVELQSGSQMYANNGAARVETPPSGQSNLQTGTIAARDDWQGSSQGASQGPSGSANSGGSVGYGSAAGQDDWQANGKGSSKSQNGGGISCNALQFSVSSQDVATGMGKGRVSSGGITCRMAVDQTAMQLVEYAVTGRRLGNVTLNWQGQLSAALTNADVSSVQFTTDSGNEVVEVTFAYQRAEIMHVGSGTRVTF
jgi:type VI protein secretion system component Hcp